MADRHPVPVGEAVAFAAGLVVLVGIGLALPEPYSLAAETVVNQPLAEAEAAEAQRQADIERLLEAVAADPTDRTRSPTCPTPTSPARPPRTSSGRTPSC